MRVDDECELYKSRRNGHSGPIVLPEKTIGIRGANFLTLILSGYLSGTSDMADVWP